MLASKNITLWNNYEKYARARGRLVAHILSNFMYIPKAHVLDFGCGTGGISVELANQGAHVTALDANIKKIAVLEENIEREGFDIKIINQLPDSGNQFDAIILLDVIEHLVHPQKVLKKLNKLLKPNGVIYLSTPNKISALNFLVDPHFSLPIISTMKRKNVKRVLVDWLAWQPKDRIDFPELMTLKELDKLMKNSALDWQFVNSMVTEFAFENPESVWNRESHLEIIKRLKNVGLTSAVQKNISDKIDPFNIWLNPTWYVIAQKSPIPKFETGLN